MLKLIKATLSDWQDIGAIESKSSTACFKALTLQGELEEYLTKSSVYFVEADGVRVGSIGFEKQASNVAQLQGLNIKPEHRGKGYGNEVVKLLVDEAEKEGITRMHLTVHPTSVPAIITYLKNGFVVTSYKDNYFGDGEPRLVMERTSTRND
jgi:ribosomal-protein-alanine N-acetyltransferase